MKRNLILLFVAGSFLLSTYQVSAMLEFFKKSFGAGETEQARKEEHASRLERKKETVDFWKTVVRILKAQGENPRYVTRAEKNLHRAEDRLKHPRIFAPFKREKRSAPVTRPPHKAPKRQKRAPQAKA
jgi:hypothetical protein